MRGSCGGFQVSRVGVWVSTPFNGGCLRANKIPDARPARFPGFSPQVPVAASIGCGFEFRAPPGEDVLDAGGIDRPHRNHSSHSALSIFPGTPLVAIIEPEYIHMIYT